MAPVLTNISSGILRPWIIAWTAGMTGPVNETTQVVTLTSWIDLGAQRGGAEVAITTEHYRRMVDEYPAPVAIIPTRQNIKVVVNMTQDELEGLENLIPGSTYTGSATPGTIPDWLKVSSTLTPVYWSFLGIYTNTESTNSYLWIPKCAVVDPVTLSFKLDGDRMDGVPIGFEGCIDENQTGKENFVIYRITSA